MTDNMKIFHIHFGIKDLPNAVKWFCAKLDILPIYHNSIMAYIKFFVLWVILDKEETDTEITLA